MEVRTSPWREVQIKVKSTELEALGLPVTLLRASIGWNDAWPFSVISMHDSMTITLPPGDYESLFYETEIWAIQRPSFSVSAGSGALRLEVDLPATRLARLYGKAAPELDSIQAWKGAGPLKLADLRGKAVILDFWGSWCGPCVAQMPELVDLYLEYHDRGLEVIAVHTALAETDADFGEQVAGLVRNSWNGRELPFPLAIDQPTAEIRPGSTRPFRGQTIAEYGITLFPTAILIDREGRVVGEFSYAGGRGRDMLAKALGLPMPPTEAPPSP
ncbi:MAG TPA: TlpA disulfide reductase family protein [Lacipirellulaceae bacterium]|nr:TlpA disulfide reductase family protein [Lacipirellulaceae bacterium]